jgi:pimeloyl-ACP methyl ester carboxylesterase
LVGTLFTAWSFFRRSLILLLVARADTEPLDAKNTNGDFIDGAGGEKLHIRSFGPTGAPVLLFSHGWSLDQTVWQYAVRDLSRTFRIVTWDLPRLGRSTVRKVSLAAMAENLKVVLERQQQPVHLVGHSIGGMTIETLLRDDPAVQGRRAAGIVLVNTTYTNPLRTVVLSPLFRLLRWPLIEPALWLQIILMPIAWLMSWQSYLSGWTHLTARRDAIAVPTDVTDAVAALAGTAESSFGGIDVWVNNAGTGVAGSFQDAPRGHCNSSHQLPVRAIGRR